MDLEKIREDFPLLRGENPPVYFDNACMTLKPEPVIKAVEEYYREYPACAGRSGHRLGETVGRKVAETRKMLADFIGAKSEKEIIFTRNTTEGINLVAKSLNLKKGDTILVTDKEHNSNLIPWQILKKEKGTNLIVSPSKKDNGFDIEAFKKLINQKIKLVSVVFTSNLDGVSTPVKEITSLAHQGGSPVLIDAAQAAGHEKISVRELDCDFLALSGHKMLGPTGTGALYAKEGAMTKLRPFIAGGGTVSDSTYERHEFLAGPERFEAGLQDYAGIIALKEAMAYLKKISFDNIKKQEEKLNKIITEGLRTIKGLTIIGPEESEKRGGIINFYHDKMPSHEIALLLDKTYNIMTRSGRHCVHSWYNSRKVKDSVRASVYFYNTGKEAEYFVKSLKKVIDLI